MAATSTLTDNFDDNSVNATLWSQRYGTTTEVGGRGRVVCDTGWSAFVSASTYTLDSMYLRAYPAAAASATGSSYCGMWFEAASNNRLGIYLDLTTGNLVFQVTSAGSVTTTTVVYNSTTHAWWDIRVSGGNYLLRTSPDGVTWTTQRTGTTPAAVASATTGYVKIEAHRDAGTTNNFEFDNFNVAPAVSATVQPAVVTATTTIGAPTVTAVRTATVQPATISASTTIGTPTVSAARAATVQPAVVTASTTIGTPAVSAVRGATVAAATVTGTTTIPAPTVATVTGATVQPATVVASTTIGVPIRVEATSGTSMTVGDLVAGSSYQMRVRAVDAAGNRSAWSDPVSVDVPLPGVNAATVIGTVSIPTPAVAGGSAATAQPATVTATTTIPAPTVTAVRTATVQPATVAASTTIGVPTVGASTVVSVAGLSTTLTSLDEGSDYSVRVRAVDSAGNRSDWSDPETFTTSSGTEPTVTAGIDRPVVNNGEVALEVSAVPPGGQTISGHAWTILSGGGSLTGADTATPTYTAPSSGTGVAVVQDVVTASGGGSGTASLTVAYGPNVVAAENQLAGTPRESWDLVSPNLGGISTLQGFCDGFSINKDATANFKIAQSDGAGWSAEIFRLGWYDGDGARSYGTLTPDSTQLAASQAQPAPGDADTSTTLLSADAGNWSTTLTWEPPAWVPSGMYVLRLNRTGGGSSHVMFIVRDDARAAGVMLMPSDSTWSAYNAWGGMGGSQYAGNSLYYGTAVNQYAGDCARFVSYNRPLVNRGANDSGRTYGAVGWSNFFTAEYGFLRFLERNGHDVKYYACIDAAGDSTGTHLTGNGTTRGGAAAAIAVGHNEYWSDVMRSGWETAKAAGVSLFFSAGNEVFWRTVGSSPDADGRPRVQECQKSTIGGRGNTRPQWTGTWRDPDGAGKGGNQPENTLTGTIFTVNGPDMRALVVPFAGGYSAQPMWRHTAVADLTTGQTWSSPGQILGFEWDTYGPAGTSSASGGSFMAAPHPQARFCSTVTYSISSGLLLTDAGDVYDASGTATHRLVVHPSSTGAGITFGAGTVNWALGLDDANVWQQGSDNTSQVLQQATVNLLTDMGAPPATLMSGLTQPEPVVWYETTQAATVVASTTIATPTVTAAQGATVQPATVVASTTIATPTVSAVRAAQVQPATVAASTTIATPTVTAVRAAQVQPATVAASTTIATPVVTTSGTATVQPVTVTASTTIATPAVSAVRTAQVQPATVAASTTIGAPVVTASGTATVQPTAVAASTTIGVPTVSSVRAAQVQPATVAASITIGAPVVTTSGAATAQPATVAATTTIGTPTVTSVRAAQVQPATVTASTTVGAPTVTTPGGATVSAGVVAVTVSIAVPVVSTGPDPTVRPVTVVVGTLIAQPIVLPAPSAPDVVAWPHYVTRSGSAAGVTRSGLAASVRRSV